jgi:hypothetical protein
MYQVMIQSGDSYFSDIKVTTTAITNNHNTSTSTLSTYNNLLYARQNLDDVGIESMKNEDADDELLSEFIVERKLEFKFSR